MNGDVNPGPWAFEPSGFLHFMVSTKKNGVYYPGHASAIARLNEQHIMFDPVWNHAPYGDYWEFRPPQRDCTGGICRMDWAVISHIHADHLCERILKEYHGRVMIMAGRPDLARKIAATGCQVIELQPRKWIKFGVGLEIYFVPHDFNSIDSSCFVRCTQSGYCVYHGNDNFLSIAGVDKLRRDIGRVDVAMVPYAFIHWYPFLMEMDKVEKMREIARLNAQSLNQAKTFIYAFSPRHVIPFGSSLYHVENEELNKYLAKPSDVAGALDFYAGCYILDGFPYFEVTPQTDDLDDVRARLTAVDDRVPGHQIVVNDVVVDLQTLDVYRGKITREYTKFTFKPMEFRQWLRGAITLEQAIGTRQFTCYREPNVYNLKVFEFMNRYL